MAHLALYRKYRPQNFATVLGQEDTARVLRSAVAAGRTTHAYLFCGTRGTGKTSTARILAKALNCQDPRDGEPCGVCDSCRAVTEGRALDVFEIDAASNRGIDEARDLLEKVHFIPVEGKYKIYIIDEVHMLTTDAFNALLKTFEEPPRHVVFILATTESRKVPLTILSRCQRYDFKPIPQAEIAAHLRDIAGREDIRIEADALDFLAAKAKGSMRDALSLLDQIAGEGKTELTLRDVVAVFGSVEGDFWPRLLQNIAAQNAHDIFNDALALEAQGKDIRLFFQDLQELLGNILARSDGGYDRDVIRACTGLLRDDQLLELITIIGEGEQFFRYNKDSRLVFRFLMAKMLRAVAGEAPAAAAVVQTMPAKATAKAEPPPFAPSPSQEAPPLEEIPFIDDVPPPEAAPPDEDIPPFAMAEPPAPKPAAKPVPPPAPAPPKAEPPAPAPVAKPQGTPPLDAEYEAAEDLRSDLFRAVREKSRQTYTWLSPAEIGSVRGDTVTLLYESDDSIHYQRIQSDEHLQTVKAALTALCGREMNIKVEARRSAAGESGSLF